MSRLGSMVVRIALENLAGYKADLDKAAQTTADGAAKIEQGTTRAGAGITRLGGAMGGAAGTATELAGAAGVAGMGLGALAAVAGVAAYAAHKGSQEQKAYNQALILTGNISGTTASQMQGMAAGIDKVVGTHYQAAEALAAMASTGQVAGSNLQAFAQVAVQTQRVVGTSVADTAKIFADLGEEPVKASIKLNQAMNYLTAATFAQIKAAQDLGDSEAAASLAQTAYATAMATRTEQIRGNLGTLERAWIGVKDVAFWAWDAMLGLGRPTDPSKVLDDTSKKIAALRERLADKGLTANWGGEEKLQGELNVLLEQQGVYQEIERMARRAAGVDAERARLQKDGIAGVELVAKANDKALTKQEQMNKALDDYRGGLAAIRASNPDSKLLDQDQIAKTEAAIKASFETKAIHETITAYDRLMKAISEKTAADQLDLQTQGNLTAGQKEASKIMDDLRTGTLKLTEAEKIELTTKLEKRLATEQEKIALAGVEKSALAAADAHAKYIADLNKGLATTEQELAQQLEHNARLGLSKIAVAELDAAKLESLATVQDLIVFKKIEQGLDEDAYRIYVAQAKTLRDRAAAMKAGAYKETALEDEKAIAAERQAGWVETDRIARETFTTIAENGTNAAEVVGKAFKKALLSAIYEATIRPVAFQIYSSIAGGVPGGASGGASGLASGVAGNALGGASVFGAGGMTGALAGGAGWVTGSTTLGGSISAATSLMAAEGGFAAGATMLAGAFLPIVAGVAVLAELFKKGEYVQSTGSSVQYFDAAGKTTDKSTLANNFATTAADTYVTGIKDSYAALAKQLGATNAGGMFAYASNSSDGGKFGVQVAVGSANYSTGELKASSEALTLEASRAVFAALQGSELPKYLAGVFDGITASTATADQINSALTYAQNIKILHDQFEQLPFQNLRDLSLAATKGLIEFSGGLDKLGANLSGYYANFYDEGERQAQTLKNINATLAGVGIEFSAADIAAEDARKKFRALVETVQDLNTENDQRTLAALLSVQGAFADLTTEAKAATTAIDAQTDAQRALQAAWSAEGARLDALAKDSADRLLAGQQAVADLRNEATQQYLDAQQRVTDAQRNLAEVLHTTIKGFEDFLGTLDDAQTPTVRLVGARQNFDNLTARAQAGDTAAVGQLTASAKTLLDLSKGYSATIQDYRRDEARVRNVLNEGIRAGNAQLALLPKEMQQATDPLKAAYEQLAQATADEQAARVLAIAMQASLTSTEKSLGDKYLDAIKALPDEKALKKFYDDTLSAAADAAKVAAAAAAAAVAILARLTAAGAAGGATADPGTPTATAKDTVLHGVGGIAMFDTGDISAGGGSIGAGEAIAQLNAYAQYNGKDAALARIVELGGTPAMLDRLRTIAGPSASFDVGIDDVPYDMNARVHKGEKIFKASDNRELMTRLSSPQENNNALAAEVKLLRSQNDTLGRELGAALAQIALYLRGTADSTDRIRQLEEKWDAKGTPPNRAAL